jgi:ribulose-phosphate 3-epimerase
MIIAPSILACPFHKLGEVASQLQEVKEDLWIHIDVMDGHFVPNLSFGTPMIEMLSAQTKVHLDVHLMVSNPAYYIEEWKKFRIHNMTFHWEAAVHQDRVLNLAKNYYSSCGIALNPATPLTVIPDYLWQEFNLLLLMTVNPGYGGQKFIQPLLSKIATAGAILSAKGLESRTHLQVDGGVGEEEIPLLKQRGVNNVVMGSKFFSEVAMKSPGYVEIMRAKFAQFPK